MLSNVINNKRLCLITAVDCGFIVKGKKCFHLKLENREKVHKSGMQFFLATQSKTRLNDVISLIPHKIASYTLLYLPREKNARLSFSLRTINNRLRSEVTPISGRGSE